MSYKIVLSVILKNKMPDDLAKMPNMQSTIEALIPYTGAITTLNFDSSASNKLILN